MPGVLMAEDAGRKRKRTEGAALKSNGVKPRKAPKTSTSSDTRAEILLLEEQILQSREHYNNIVVLQKHVNKADKEPKTAIISAIALCRVFCRFVAGDALIKRKDSTIADAQILRWLKLRLRDYVESLTSWIGSPDASREGAALTMLMRIVKQETSQGPQKSEQAWRAQTSTFGTVVRALLVTSDAEAAREEFVEKYVEEHDDVRFYTFLAVKQSLTDHGYREFATGNALHLLSKIGGIPGSEEHLEHWYGEAPSTEKCRVYSLNAHRKVAQAAWLAIFRSPLSRDRRKLILSIATAQILPWFPNRLETLADFFTDSFNEGGSLSLLALSGIFHLMTSKNLDYPDFYTKLYSLLDAEIMHSKHRSRFFRLLDSFMSSTHLPAAMVASFIKRLAGLSLQGPTGAIVWVVPWVYNMVQKHPACTFMLHRPYHPAHTIYASYPEYEEQGMDDPFKMEEADPMATGAIDSSLWELETLTNHYHPNVATLAKILGEQFTKREYGLEDFLDHSYASMVEAELGKELKKAPVVEWEIPKRIVTAEEGGLNVLGGLLQRGVELA